MRNFLIPALILACIALLFSCHEKECDQTLRNHAGFNFYTIEAGTPVDSLLDTFTVYGLTRADSLLYDSASNRSTVYLPLDPSRDVSRFIFQIDSLTDTVEISYEREEKFISHACGFITRFHIRQTLTTHNHFDSIATVNPLVTLNEDETHFNIYLSPADTSGL